MGWRGSCAETGTEVMSGEGQASEAEGEAARAHAEMGDVSARAG